VSKDDLANAMEVFVTAVELAHNNLQV